MVGAVFAPDSVLGLVETNGVDGLLPNLAGTGPVIRVQCVQPAPAANLFDRKAGVGAPLRQVLDLSVGCRLPDQGRRGTDQGPVPLLAIYLLLFQPLLIGNVLEVPAPARTALGIDTWRWGIESSRLPRGGCEP